MWLSGVAFVFFGTLHNVTQRHRFTETKNGQPDCSLDCISIAVALCSSLLRNSDSERIVDDFVSLFLSFALFSVLPVAMLL